MEQIDKRSTLTLFLIELGERFGYYGMRALLVLFLIDHYGFSDSKAYLTYSLYAAICYMVPVFAGIIADKFLGYKKLVMMGSFIICIGHLILALINFSETTFNLGLAAIAFGSGLFKGNISNLLGVIYDKYPKMRAKAFSTFYIMINIGGLLGAIFSGFIAKYYGWDFGFGIAGIGMLLSMITFVYATKFLKKFGNPPKNSVLKIDKNIFLIFVSIIGTAISFLMLQNSELFTNILSIFGLMLVAAMMYIVYRLDSNDRKRVIVILAFSIFFMIIFAFEMQLGSLINLFTERHIDRTFFGMEIPASVLQSLNPIFIIIVGFIINYTAKGSAKNIAKKFFIGVIVSAMCFLVLYLGSFNHGLDYKLDISYLLLSILLMSLGEFLIAPAMLSISTHLSPKKLQGLMMGFINFSLVYSNLSGILISKFMSVPNENFNPSHSLEIYQSGFLKIIIIYTGIIAFYCLIYKKLSNLYKSLV